MSDEDKRLLREKLKTSSFKAGNIDEETYFEVDFERVTGLVGRRQVYIQAGKAFVRLSDQVVLVLDEFKERLSHALEVTGRALPRMDEDDRLMPVLNNINKQYLGREFTSSAIAGEIQASDVDNVSFFFLSRMSLSFSSDFWCLLRFLYHIMTYSLRCICPCVWSTCTTS